ncbi:uncharacterized protein PHACADRAFT_33584 [Phanerochaete carnosa HHB-10118-sp]|uniref:Uncharacterized protein n=1 Tax=Phanerochaete carnosa (strain HHB-10118-sp) TaxID=650164 RepID=K5VR23_PHACS|nr:uncharacterized protein PHACADRAFT_33584 [Phanerochaete carnosa HHB-10118-sp]EKM49190.1 hypothetical protein PHACADRAFT_33584 [Phanerochaete carnosa HHB-10118-sp]
MSQTPSDEPPLPEPDTSNIRRYPNQARKQHAAPARMEYRHRTKNRNTAKPTPAEVAAQAAKRQENKEKHQKALEVAGKKTWKIAEGLSEELGDHPLAYYSNFLMQQSKISDSTRKTNKWNAFLSKEIKALNEDKENSGGMRERAGNFSAELSARWANMTPEEQDEAVKDQIEELDQRRENKKYAPHNVSISSFHDSRATLEKVERELKALHQRTGVEILFSAVRGDQSDFLAPHTWSTDEKLEDFFQMTFGMEFGRFTGKLESYVLSGLSGVKKKAYEDLMDLKNKVSTLIFEKFEEAARPFVVKKMNYENFDNVATRKLALVIDHWPLPAFQAPGKFNTIAELRTLHNAWHNGHARFRRLSQDELARWEQEKLTQHQPEPPVGIAGPSATVDALMQPPASDDAQPAAGTSRTFETAFPASDTPADNAAKKPRKVRKDAGTKRGPNARTRRDKVV